MLVLYLVWNKSVRSLYESGKNQASLIKNVLFTSEFAELQNAVQFSFQFYSPVGTVLTHKSVAGGGMNWFAKVLFRLRYPFFFFFSDN